MKIFFSGSITGGRDDVNIYSEIVAHLKKIGEVFTEHVGDGNLDSNGEDLDPKVVHDRDINWIKECDVLVAEITQPSIGVGYELRAAIDMDKKVLCLFRKDSGKKLSCMIRGSEDILVKEYSDIEEAKDIITSLLYCKCKVR